MGSIQGWPSRRISFVVWKSIVWVADGEIDLHLRASKTHLLHLVQGIDFDQMAEVSRVLAYMRHASREHDPTTFHLVSTGVITEISLPRWPYAVLGPEHARPEGQKQAYRADLTALVPWYLLYYEHIPFKIFVTRTRLAL
jgi:hypothetical protein